MPKFWVGDSRYQVNVVPNLKDFGDCSHDKKRIRLRSSQTPQDLLDTFCHEFWHAIDWEYGLNLSHDDIYHYAEISKDFLINNHLIDLTKFAKALKKRAD